MKRVIVVLSIIVCAGISVAGDITDNNNAGNTVVTFISDPWIPFVYGKADGIPPEKGLAVDLINEICKKTGVKCEMKVFPWKRCLVRIRKGESDAVMLLSKDAERETYMDFTDKIMDGRDLIYYRADRKEPFQWDRWEDLQSYKVGITAGFSYGNEWADAQKKYNIRTDEAMTPVLTLRKLLGGRFEIALFGEGNAIGLINDNPEFQGKFRSAEKPVQTFGCYIGFSKKSLQKELIPKINQIIREMIQDGSLNEIKKKWGFEATY